MSKDWGNMTMADRKPVLEAMSAVLKEHGADSWCKIKSVDQFVGNISAGEMMNQCSMSVEGSCDIAKKDSIPTIKAALTDAANGVDFGFEVSASIGIGCQMGEIENQSNLRDEDLVSVTHKEGEVILLDFWATWCPPCQGPMAHNQEMLEKRGAEWGDKVRIIGLSIDQDKAKLLAHVDDKKWTKVEHYWSRNGKNTADNIYGVQGVPHCLLVDTHGKIVFVGHPANRNLEEDFDNLLAGKVLTGKGTEPAGGAEGGEEKEIDLDLYSKLSEKFKTEAKKICEEEKVNAGKLQRAFLVMVVDATWNAATGKLSGEMQCIT